VRVREEPFDKTHEIAEAAGVPFRCASNVTLIACADALAFLAACRVAGVQILGAEGFDLTDGGLRPDAQAILDLSDVNDASASVDEAQTFVAEVAREGLMFEFQFTSG
jgi:hypothetical protein